MVVTIPAIGSYIPGGALDDLARSHARHRYQLATDRNGFHRCPRLKTTSALGRSSAAIGHDFGTRLSGAQKQELIEYLKTL